MNLGAMLEGVGGFISVRNYKLSYHICCIWKKAHFFVNKTVDQHSGANLKILFFAKI